MSGDWLALGAVGALAAAGALRRGSQAGPELVVLGYHCTERPIAGVFDGSTYRMRDRFDHEHDPNRDSGFAYCWADRLDTLRYQLPSRLQEGAPEWDDYDEDDERFAWEMEEWFSANGIYVVDISDVPSPDAAWCYRVSIDPRILLAWADSTRQESGHVQVLYRGAFAAPILELVQLPSGLEEDSDALSDLEIEFPTNAPWDKYDPRPVLGGTRLVRSEDRDR